MIDATIPRARLRELACLPERAPSVRSHGINHQRHGYVPVMTDPHERDEDVMAEVERGGSERPPWLAPGGVYVAAAMLVGVVLAIAFTVYLLA